MKGNILKMQTELSSPVEYKLPIGQQLLAMTPLLGKKISLEWTGIINCLATGEKISKSYNQGYSYKAFTTLARCDLCIVKPELCHYHKGTCREPEWGEKHCMQPHIIYLANTAELKIGITRERQVPTRWIDQGAVQALPILKVPNRHLSGLLEVEIKQEISDKTNWRKMLRGEIAEVDLEQAREDVYNSFGSYIDELEAEDLDANLVDIQYPVLEYPKKITSLSFDKKKHIEGTLQGIRGQYLILDTGVLNIRKHQGYEIEIDI